MISQEMKHCFKISGVFFCFFKALFLNHGMLLKNRAVISIMMTKGGFMVNKKIVGFTFVGN